MTIGQRWQLNNTEYRRNFDEYVNQQVLAGKKVVVEFVSEKRSLDQNAIINALYTDIAKQKEDESVVDIRRHCKLHYGVPILRANDEKFREVYDKGLKHLKYEDKLHAMDYLPVTSHMKTPWATEYIDTVIREYTQQGIALAAAN